MNVVVDRYLCRFNERRCKNPTIRPTKGYIIARSFPSVILNRRTDSGQQKPALSVLSGFPPPAMMYKAKETWGRIVLPAGNFIHPRSCSSSLVNACLGRIRLHTNLITWFITSPITSRRRSYDLADHIFQVISPHQITNAGPIKRSQNHYCPQIYPII